MQLVFKIHPVVGTYAKLLTSAACNHNRTEDAIPRTPRSHAACTDPIESITESSEAQPRSVSNFKMATGPESYVLSVLSWRITMVSYDIKKIFAAEFQHGIELK